MAFNKFIFFTVAIGASWLYFRYTSKEPPLPEIDSYPYWGPGAREPDSVYENEAKFIVEQKDLDDLKTRLSLPLRGIPSLEDSNFTYGFQSWTLQRIVDYWANEYDYRAREETRFNAFSQYRRTIEGLSIHYLSAYPKNVPEGVKVHPLLLIHGWPGSYLEFLDMIPLLTEPQEDSKIVFHVIAPSIPGYGLSEAPSKKGFGQLQTAQLFLKLMLRLRYKTFYVQGGDWGAVVASMMATMYPTKVRGMHVNMFALGTPGRTMRYVLGSYLPSGTLFPEEYDSLFYPMSDYFSTLLEETGYMHFQATRPDTIGAALSNSPAGLAAYILEKFCRWTHKDNLHKEDCGLFSDDFPISLDKLLDNISLYWFTKTITSSMRYYAELHNTLKSRIDEIKTDVPAAFTLFKEDLGCDPKEFAALKYTNIVYHRLEEGGHFPAMEQPEFLAEQIYEFVRIVEKRRKKARKEKKLEKNKETEAETEVKAETEAKAETEL